MYASTSIRRQFDFFFFAENEIELMIVYSVASRTVIKLSLFIYFILPLILFNFI